jgi:hypothetical protein
MASLEVIWRDFILITTHNRGCAHLCVEGDGAVHGEAVAHRRCQPRQREDNAGAAAARQSPLGAAAAAPCDAAAAVATAAAGGIKA